MAWYFYQYISIPHIMPWGENASTYLIWITRYLQSTFLLLSLLLLLTFHSAPEAVVILIIPLQAAKLLTCSYEVKPPTPPKLRITDAVVLLPQGSARSSKSTAHLQRSSRPECCAWSVRSSGERARLAQTRSRDRIRFCLIGFLFKSCGLWALCM